MAEKVSFNIASEASYVYTSSEQKFNKKNQNSKNSNATLWVIFKHRDTKQSWRNKNEISFESRPEF